MVAAFAFLTRIPLTRIVLHDTSDLGRSVPHFPLVGLAVGATGAVVFSVAQLIWSPLLAIVLSTIATVLMTGAFHEDALADSLDGFGGGWTREQVLAIMKDSRVGSYALVGVVLAMLAKIAALMTIHDLPRAHGVVVVWPVCLALMVAHTIARCSSVWLMFVLPYVRAEQTGVRASAGGPFVNGVSVPQTLVITALTVAIVTALAGRETVCVLAATVAVTAASGAYFRKRIGGITGDALGAANQAVELSVYLTMAVRPLNTLLT